MVELYLPLVLFCASMTITPGPNNLMITASGVNFGVRRSLPHLCGVSIGFPVMVVLLGVGMGAVFERYPQIHEWIYWLGVAYLVYLAWLIGGDVSATGEVDLSKRITFLKAALFQWVNPKAWVIASGAIAAFTQPDGDLFGQVLLIALVFLLVTPLCMGAWLLFGAGMRRYLTDPFRLRVFNLSMAAVLVLSLIPSLLERL